jgi:hypothetical protein
MIGFSVICSRKGCGRKFTKKTKWHEYCSKICKYIAWADRKKEEADNK